MVSFIFRSGTLRTAEQDVMKEAELLMKQHSNHPQFLVNLFRHASAITQDTDQQVAIDLLRELSGHRQHSQSQSQNRLVNFDVKIKFLIRIFSNIL